jgi:hypothetical protein
MVPLGMLATCSLGNLDPERGYSDPIPIFAIATEGLSVKAARPIPLSFSFLHVLVPQGQNPEGTSLVFFLHHWSPNLNITSGS